MMHFADCADCRQVVLNRGPRGARWAIPFKRRFGALAAVVAGCIALFVTQIWTRWGAGDATFAMKDVIAAGALLSHRPSLARLSSDFSMRQAKPVERGTERAIHGPAHTKLWAIAARLHEESAVSPVTSTLHTLGVSYLLVGETSRAVRSLEQALVQDAGAGVPIQDAMRRSGNAALLNDLAAAYQATIEHSDNVALKPLALEAVQRAWELERAPAIAWTRAVVIESFHVREPSIAAWQTYLAVDGASPWSDEARQRLRRLEEPTDAEAWGAIRERISDLDDAQLRATVARHRENVRQWCEDELLPRWGKAFLANDPLATRVLDVAGRMAAALAAAGGDAGPARAVEAIRRASPESARRLAKGHAAFGAGRDAYARSEPIRALREMDRAVTALAPELTPFAARARVERAAALYLSNDYDNARKALQDLAAGDGTLSDSCRGKVAALLGILALQGGAYEDAAGHYTRAASAFRSAGEAGFEGQQVSRLAAALELSGEHAKAQSHRDRSFRMLDRTGDRKQRHDAIIEAAYVAIVNGHDAAAELYFDTLVSIHSSARDDARICTVLVWRSAYRYRRGRTESATADLVSARQSCGVIADAAIRERALANLTLAEASVAGRDRSPIDARGLTGAIDYFTRTKSHVWLRTAYLARARTLQHNDPAAAERDFRAAIDEGERSRDTFDARDARISFAATADEIVDAYVEFLLARQRVEDAFEVADRSRGRELVDSPSAQWSTPRDALVPHIRKALPFGGALVEYRVLSESVVVWVVTNDSLAIETLPVSLASLQPSIDSLPEDMPRAARIEKTVRLYDALLRPVERHLDGATSLAIVPDDELERVPWSALHDRAQQRFVFQTRATVVSPSAGLFIESTNRWRERSGVTDRVLVVTADAGGGGMATLPEARKEVEGLARIHPAARIVDGSRETASSLLSQARDATVLQFVGHTVVERDRTLRTLRLGPAEDARLGLAAIAGASLPKLRLVYLSACETDTGPILKSEGSITIARSFFAAGAPVIVGTLWPVRDEIARAASRSFHEGLRSGETPAESLRRAQLELLARFGSDADWAAFRLIGAGL
jgi:CHAT domain-containing protein/tetratricopeptide (TPR) repeat protein